MTTEEISHVMRALAQHRWDRVPKTRACQECAQPSRGLYCSPRCGHAHRQRERRKRKSRETP